MPYTIYIIAAILLLLMLHGIFIETLIFLAKRRNGRYTLRIFIWPHIVLQAQMTIGTTEEETTLEYAIIIIR